MVVTSITVPRETLAAAKVKAAGAGTTVSIVLRDALENFVKPD